MPRVPFPFKLWTSRPTTHVNRSGFLIPARMAGEASRLKVTISLMMCLFLGPGTASRLSSILFFFHERVSLL